MRRRDDRAFRRGPRHVRTLALALAAGLALAAPGGRVRAAEAAAPAALPTLAFTVEQAVLQALANNPAVAVERLSPAIQRTFEAQERAAFDPVLSGQAARQRTRAIPPPSGTNVPQLATTDGTTAGLGIALPLPSGTRVEVGGQTELTSAADADQKLWASRAGLTVSQSLLRGAGMAANLASLRQARLNTATSAFEFRGFVEALVDQVERAYWDSVLAEQQRDIYRESVRLAETQLTETVERIRAGALASIERAAAEAELAAQRETLLNAESAVITARLRLVRLVSPPDTNQWLRVIELRSAPVIPEGGTADVESHVAAALRRRPDLNQARLAIARNDLDVVKTRNGLLPKLDVFITLGRTGYADSFGGSLHGELNDGYDTQAGLSADYPFGNRGARAQRQRSALAAEQARAALDNLAQLVQVDVRSAWVEVNRAREAVKATQATRHFQEVKLEAEREKFRLGKSTTLLVAQAQRDWVQSRAHEAQAVVSALDALTTLYRLDGSLLDRRGLAAAGRAFDAAER